MSSAFRSLLRLLPAAGVLLLCLADSFVSAQGLQPPIDRKAWMVPSPSEPLKIVKQAEYSRTYPDAADYMRILERFPLYGERGWRGNYMGEAGLGFFGDPDHAEMGLRSMGNFIFVMSLLASDPAYDPEVPGYSREHVLSRARSCLEYMTRSHVTGDIPCGDGKPWGDHWQSAWWTAKMALGADLIWESLTPAERERVERVVVHEASRHLDRKAPSGAYANTRSEENGWDTEVMAAAIAMFPDHPNAGAWRQKLIEFDLNTLSAPQDLTSDRIVDGKPLRDQVYTENIHADFTIENHGAYHTCYMSCPLHSIAWGYYAMKSAGVPPPEAHFHHFRDVWERMKPTFLERRFAYVEGKDWPRYAYGMYFILPALVVLQQEFGDASARAIEALRVRTFEEEQILNADGSFFGKRFTNNQMMDRLAEYETDCYANLGVCYLLHRLVPSPPVAAPSKPDFLRDISGRHISREAEYAHVRTPHLYASLAWKFLSGRSPQALFVPEGFDDGVEWRENNILGRITVEGVDLKKGPLARHTEELTENGGFRSSGRITYLRPDALPAFSHFIEFEVDPSDRSAIVESTFVAHNDIKVTEIEGLRLMVANDIFNGGRRTWRSDLGEKRIHFDLDAPQPPTETMTLTTVGRRWVNINNTLGVVQLLDNAPDFTLRVSNRRNAQWGSIHFDALGCPAPGAGAGEYKKGDVILHTRFVLLGADARGTRARAERVAGEKL